MGLFTDPVTLDTDHAFQFRGQEYDKKASVGVYVEAAAAISEKSLLTVKHDSSGASARHLLQRTVSRVPAADADENLRRITINFTIVADPLFTDVEVSEEVDILVDAIGEANFVKSLLLNLL